ncbi:MULTISPECIES: DNA adenine methylase [Subtercola]|uniref:site-specific DNA-methyltransferase (adenine-specific) n=1 Tax=Subtercola vilae TaxID=2056433 RepID=A0A4V4REE1_9MICO|nr:MULTISPECIES: DNA adenine methylase [Subtercola]MEA9986566.1 DNA adenine methylase [Subtercola sp. RTI3]TIH32064.1 hypothetical protein D4765_16205 [Subtercola vilae]
MSSGVKRINPPYLFGGKRRVADFVVPSSPEWFGGYVEPFLGSGASAIALMQGHPEASFTLNSPSEHVVDVWLAVQYESKALIALMREHRALHSAGHFAAVRRWDAEGELPQKTLIERAARFVYLTATNPGGGYPVDESGLSTASFGQAPVAFDEANLRALAGLLADRDVRLSSVPAFELVPQIRDEDLVLVDTTAAPDALTDRELKSLLGTLTARGAYLLVTAPTDARAALFDSWNTLTRVSDHPDGERLWGNGTLERALRLHGAP